MIISKNKLVACNPFPKTNVEKKFNRGIMMAEHKISLQELTVLFNSENYTVNSTIYVKGDRVNSAWAKEVLVFEEKEFILVPESEIVFVETETDGFKIDTTTSSDIASVALSWGPTR